MHLQNALWQRERLRRLGILRTLLLVVGGGVLALIMVLLLLAGGLNQQDQTIVFQLVSLLAVLGLAGIFVRLQWLEPAAHTLFGAMLLTVIATSVSTGLSGKPTGTSGLTIFALFIPIVGATLLLRPVWSFGYALLALIAYDSCISRWDRPQVNNHWRACCCDQQ